MRLIDYFAELVSIVLFARQDPDLCAKLAGENLQKKFLAEVEQVKERCRAAGYGEEEIDDALFAVVALADESFLCSGSVLRDDWQHLYLQKTLFDTSSAGDEFFNKFRKLPRLNNEVLEVYFYCLGLGFKGRYYNDSKKLNRLVSSSLKRLTGSDETTYPEQLFPGSYRGKKKQAKRWIGRWVKTAAFNLIFVLLPLLMLTGVYIYCSSSLSMILNTLLGSSAG